MCPYGGRRLPSWADSRLRLVSTVGTMLDDRLDRVLAEMTAIDARRGQEARFIIDSLTGGEGLDVLDLAAVLRFAWYGLPLKWVGPTARHMWVVEIAGELFQRLGLDQYASVFRSSETVGILEAYGRSPDEGFKRFQAAYARSGVDPPDVDDFAWGEVMGSVEAGVLTEVERALEAAIVSGRIVPGKAGWRSVARSITADVLDGPHPDLPIQRRRDVILTERLEQWVREAEARGRELHILRARHANRLLHAVPVPRDVTVRLSPISWILGHAAEGIRLTSAGYLPTAMVREGWELFEWKLGWSNRAPRSESEMVELHELHQLLRRLGAVRRRGSELRISSLGRRMLEDVELAWRTVAGGITDGEWAAAVAETMTLLLLDGVRRDAELEERAAAMLAEAGWRSEDGPPAPTMAMSAWYVTRRPLRALGGVEGAGDWRARETVLTPFGEATLIERMRVAASGPRTWQ